MIPWEPSFAVCDCYSPSVYSCWVPFSIVRNLLYLIIATPDILLQEAVHRRLILSDSEVEQANVVSHLFQHIADHVVALDCAVTVRFSKVHQLPRLLAGVLEFGRCAILHLDFPGDCVVEVLDIFDKKLSSPLCFLTREVARRIERIFCC